MNVYIDTEFNGHQGELLSMALVTDDGREFYEEIDAARPLDEWVAHNVAPKFTKTPIPYPVFRKRLHAFLIGLGEGVTFVCDWHADMVHLFESFTGDDYASSIDYGCRALVLSGPSDIQPECPHNALSDARALRDWHMRQ